MILAVILQLTLIVLVHELGHYFFARLCGVQVLSFNIGFGPAVWRLERGGTEYALRLVPLGGYVQLGGMDESPRRVPPGRSYEHKSLGQRWGVIGGGALFNVILAWLIFVCLYLTRQPWAFWPATAAFWRFVLDFLQSLLGFLARPNLAELAGPLGILEVSAAVVRQGWSAFWFYTAFLSLNLGVFNLLPLPALDGGRLVFLLYELIFRRRPAPVLERWVHALGFVLLLGLLIMVSWQDVARLKTRPPALTGGQFFRIVQLEHIQQKCFG
ncbi:MAG: site-2 protease family protein [Candidatus Margulisbacteria bacterium]|nr:site-2 protease family protein [Candidatus Margulisiibacteriota bacterium]